MPSEVATFLCRRRSGLLLWSCIGIRSSVAPRDSGQLPTRHVRLATPSGVCVRGWRVVNLNDLMAIQTVAHLASSAQLPSCLWINHASRHCDFLTARRRWLHGSCSSRCMDAVCKPGCLWLCESLAVLLGLRHVASGTARRARVLRSLWSVFVRFSQHRP